MERAFPLAMKNVSIKHLQLFEDRSDAARRVVIKTEVSMCGMVRAWWRWGAHAHMEEGRL